MSYTAFTGLGVAALNAKFDALIEAGGVSRAGKTPPRVPETVANLFAFYSFEGLPLTVSAGLRHRGAEISLTANPIDRLNVIAGAVLMEPRVTGEAVTSGRVGRKPLGQSAAILRGNANYKLPFLEGVSLDVAASWFSKRAASRDNLVSLDPYLLMDVGALYQFKLGRSPATFRIQMQNITDTFAWSVVGSNSYGLMDKRRFSAFLAVDF